MVTVGEGQGEGMGWWLLGRHREKECGGCRLGGRGGGNGVVGCCCWGGDAVGVGFVE